MKYFFHFILLFLLLGLVSCFPVQHLAREFADCKKNKVIVITPPSNIFYSYYPYDPDKYQKNDTVFPIEESQYLKHIDDSLLLELFIEGLEASINKYDMDLYLSDSINDFFQDKKEAYMFSVVQVELLEYPDTFEQKAVFGDVLYVQDFERNNILYNTWFEYIDLHDSGKPEEILFNMQYTGDYFDGNFSFDWRTSEVTYQYTPYKVDVNDIYDLGYFAGLQNGEYIVDYLFNLYLKEQLDKKHLNYYRFDRLRNAAQKANDDRFIIMEP